jgi:hypothetical protein
MAQRPGSSKTSTPDDSSEIKDSSSSIRKKEKLQQDGSITINNEDTIKAETSAIESGEDRDTIEDIQLIGDGKDVKGEDDDELKIVMGTEADVTDEDLILLGDPDQDQDGGEDELISNEGLDDTDFEGEPLNEGASDMNTAGEDLDMPESEDFDPKKERIEGADEENSYFSLGSDDNDETVEGTP